MSLSSNNKELQCKTAELYKWLKKNADNHDIRLGVPLKESTPTFLAQFGADWKGLPYTYKVFQQHFGGIIPLEYIGGIVLGKGQEYVIPGKDSISITKKLVKETGLPKGFFIAGKGDRGVYFLDINKMRENECPVVIWNGKDSIPAFDNFTEFLGAILGEYLQKRYLKSVSTFF